MINILNQRQLLILIKGSGVFGGGEPGGPPAVTQPVVNKVQQPIEPKLNIDNILKERLFMINLLNNNQVLMLVKGSGVGVGDPGGPPAATQQAVNKVQRPIGPKVNIGNILK